VTKRGPAQAVVGQMAQFVVDVTNTGRIVLHDVDVVDQYDATLRPTMATDGYRGNGNRLTWRFAELHPGETTRVEIRCECLRANGRTCNRVEVATREGAQASDEVCFPITGAAAPGGGTTPSLPPTTGTPGGGLTITATDLHDPIAVGKEMTYVVQVANAGTTPQRQVAVTAIVPEGMVPVRLGTTGPRKNGSILQAQFAGNRVIFPPMPEVAPGRTMIYRIRVRTQQPGQTVFTAEATSQQQPQPLRAQATTQVNEE
jgi:uncharacterized repeat protein (TIGR01451 family)